MSYILDALNKSEQERAKKRAPDLHFLGRAQENNSLGFKQLTFVVVFIAVINVGALWYFLGDWRPPTVGPTASQPTVIDPVIDHVPIDVPPLEKRELPQVEVTAHIYAEDADLRMVKIDGVSRKEGDLIQAGLTLVEITESGVVLNFEGEVHTLDIIEDWQLY